jgi:hypothetical protein
MATAGKIPGRGGKHYRALDAILAKVPGGRRRASASDLEPTDELKKGDRVRLNRTGAPTEVVAEQRGTTVYFQSGGSAHVTKLVRVSDRKRSLDSIVSRIPKTAFDRALAKVPDRRRAARDADVKIVHNRLLGGWYVVTGPHQSPLSGRFSSKEEAQQWLIDRKNKRDGARDADRVTVKYGARELPDGGWGIHVKIFRNGSLETEDLNRQNWGTKERALARAKQIAEGDAEQEGGKVVGLIGDGRTKSLDHLLRSIPDHGARTRATVDRLRRRLGLDAARSAKEIIDDPKTPQWIKESFGRLKKGDPNYASLMEAVHNLRVGAANDDSSYLVTAKFTDSTTFRQIYESLGEAEAKVADLDADPNALEATIQPYEGDVEESATGDVEAVLNEVDARESARDEEYRGYTLEQTSGRFKSYTAVYKNGRKLWVGSKERAKEYVDRKIAEGVSGGGSNDRKASLDRALRSIPDRRASGRAIDWLVGRGRVRDAREGQRVKIMGGMREFVGQTGTIISEEGSNPKMYRVRLDNPVNIPGVGKVTDDLWEGNLLKKIG